MTMKRAARSAIAIAVVLAAAAGSLLHVRRGDVAVVSWRGGGTPDLRAPGWSVRLPFFPRAQIFQGGTVTAQATLSAASREGSSIGLPYSVRARPDPQAL